MRLRANDIYRVLRAELAGFSEELFSSVIIAPRSEHAVAVLRIDHPSGETPRGLADVSLRVMPLAEGKKLENLAGEVLVRCLALALSAVEPDQHGRIPHHGGAKFAERPGAETAEGFILAKHEVIEPNLRLARGKMAVPEKSQFFAHPRIPGPHALKPPGPHGIECFLHRPVVFAEFHPGCRLLAPQCTPQFAPPPILRRIRLRWRRQTAAVIRQQAIHGTFQPHRRQNLRVLRRASETRPAQQMRRSIGIP